MRTDQTALVTEAELIEETSSQSQSLVRRASSDVVLMPVMDIHLAKQRLTELQQFCAEYLQESTDGGNDGGDYGIIPGAGKKKVLFKSGGEKLTDIYGLAARYVIMSKVEEWDRGLFDFTIQCELHRKTDEMFVGSGVGSCSSWEAKYRWREGKRVCPQCHQDTIIKGKDEYGGGWLCWGKKGGCGAKFSSTDPGILDQKVGRLENSDLIDAKNTVLKIAKKRAFIDAVISVTRSSGIFTQDLDELTSEQPAAQTDAKPKSTTPAHDRAQRRPESTMADDADAAPGDKFLRGHVTAVEERTGTTRGKPWTVYLVTVAGQKAGTFDRGLADEARAAFDTGEEVDAHLTPGRKAGTWELASLVRVVEPADGHLFEDGGNDEPF